MRLLRLRLDRSPLLERLVTALHLIAVSAVWTSQIVWSAQLALTAGILASWGFRRMRAFEYGREQHLVCTGSAGWSLEEDGRDPQALSILPDTVVSPWLIVLHGRIGEERRQWVIARDSLDSESFRCLRVHLRVLPLAPAKSGGMAQPGTASGADLFG